jgi:hypothetical protein
MTYFYAAFCTQLFHITSYLNASHVHLKVALIQVIGGSYVLFPGTLFINILMSTIGMLLASISFSFLVYTLVNRSQFGNIVALIWIMLSIILYPNIEESVTPNGMAGFGWNFVMACYRTYTLMEVGVSATAPGYNLSVAITWLYIDAGIYLALAWYAAAACFLIPTMC